MALIRYRGRDPFKALDSLRGEINRLFDSSLDIFPRLSEDVFTPSTDVWEDKNNVYVESELPGFDKKDIQVSMKENTLVVSAKKEEAKEEKERDYYRSERYRGRYYREIDLPSSVDTQKINAQFKNGVLNISLHKKEEEKGKEIKVNVE